MLRIIAIDPGTQRTGYAVFEISNTASRLIECGTVFVRGKDLPEKLLSVHRGIERLFRRLKPRQVVIERPFVCMLAAAVIRARVFEYAPSQVKKAVTGDGNAPKEKVQQFVSATLGLRQAPEPDTADAIALAICHLNRL